MKCRGITSKSHRLEIQHMVLMRACFCHKFSRLPVITAAARSAHAALKATELFPAEPPAGLGARGEAWLLARFRAAPAFGAGGDLKYSTPLSGHVSEHVSDHVSRSLLQKIWSLTPSRGGKHLLGNGRDAPESWSETNGLIEQRMRNGRGC